MNPIFFPTPAAFRDWLETNHESAAEVWVGFHRKGTGRQGLTWSEAVDEALCYGWIDGVRKKIDEERYTNRFTPRRVGSTWSRINIARAEELIRSARMRPAGRRAFEARDPSRSGLYSFEQGVEPALGPDANQRFRANTAAWRFWMDQPPGYRRQATWWVVSAKREETRERRLRTLIDDSEAGRRIPPLRRAGE